MKQALFFLCAAISLVSLNGCASASRSGRSATPPPPPEPVTLVELPDYGPDKSASVDKSAGCYLLPARTGLEGDSVPATFRSLLRQGLTRRGYTVIDSDGAAESRALIQKQIMVVDYATRTRYLPVRQQTACDVYMVLKVQDCPTAVSDPPDARYFSVIARDIGDQPGQAKNASIERAVDHFFCLDTFCDALAAGDR